MKAIKILSAVLSTTALLIFTWLIGWYLPAIDRIEKAQARLAGFSSRLNSASTANRQLEEEERTYQNLLEIVREREKKLIDTDRLTGIAAVLNNELRAYNLKLIEVSPVVSRFMDIKEGKIDDVVTELPVDLRIQGNFMSFASLLKNMDNLPFTISTDAVRMKADRLKKGQLTIDLKAGLLIKTDNRQ